MSFKWKVHGGRFHNLRHDGCIHAMIDDKFKECSLYFYCVQADSSAQVYVKHYTEPVETIKQEIFDLMNECYP
jgi:hypothetical protein